MDKTRACRLIVTFVRLTCAVVFLYVSLNISWTSVLAALALFLAVYLPHTYKEKKQGDSLHFSKSPLRGKPNETDEADLNPETRKQIYNKVCQLVTYNATLVQSLDNFLSLKENSECTFAKNARLWGSAWNENLGLEENVYRCVPTFLKFCCLCDKIGLDGFVFELPGEPYGQDIHVFSKAVWITLKIISDHDPAGVHCMDKSYIGRRGWVFQFDKVTMFVTTFAPFYSETNPRFGHGTKNCYILFQPEISFAQHDLPVDTPVTNWSKPKTVRDRIRCRFQEAGRPYLIRDTVHYPISHDIVRPLSNSEDVVEFWKLDTWSE